VPSSQYQVLKLPKNSSKDLFNPPDRMKILSL